MDKNKKSIVRKKLREAFLLINGGEKGHHKLLKQQASNDFAFHMVDWVDELEILAKMYANPSKYDMVAWKNGVNGFLIHVIGHLLKACEIYGFISDPFMVLKEPRRKKKRRSSKANQNRPK